MEMPVPAWEPEAVAFLVEHFETRSAGQIAFELGVTRSAVCGKINRLRGKGVLPQSGSAKHYRVDPHANARRRRPKPDSITMPRTAKPKPPRITVALATPSMVVVASDQPVQPCGMLELDATTCRWPIWHDVAEPPPKFYCGGTPLDGLPYCLHHCRIAYHHQREETTR